MNNQINPTSGADLKIINGIQMMGSRAVADVTGKNHDHVKRDILAMLEQLKIYSPDLENDDFKGFVINRKKYQGRHVIDEIFLNENLSMTLVTGYDAGRRLAVIQQWQEMKQELSQPRITNKPAQQEISMNNDILSLARVVAEATASATMKAVMEVSGVNMIAAPASPAPVVATHVSDACDLVPIHKVSWETGLSDATCRRLVTFASLPTGHIESVRGICVGRQAFISAFQVLLEEATPPSGKRKRWNHPVFGGFELRQAVIAQQPEADSYAQ